MIAEIIEKEIAAANENKSLGLLADTVSHLFESVNFNTLTKEEIEEFNAALTKAASLPAHDEIGEFHLETIASVHFDFKIAVYA